MKNMGICNTFMKAVSKRLSWSVVILVFSIVCVSLLSGCGTTSQPLRTFHKKQTPTSFTHPGYGTIADSTFVNCGSTGIVSENASATPVPPGTPVSSSDALVFVHEFLTEFTGIHATGAIVCNAPVNIPYTNISKYIVSNGHHDSSYWVVVVLGKFQINSSSGSINDQYIVFFLSTTTPIRLNSFQYFSGILPTVFQFAT